MKELQREFHLEEFRQLKAEITGILSRIDTLARYSIVGLKLPKELYAPAWYLPAALAILSGLAAAVSIARVLQIGSYLRLVESALGARGLGWEAALKVKWPIVTFLGVLFWLAVVGSTLYAAYSASTFVNGITLTCSAEKK